MVVQTRILAFCCPLLAFVFKSHLLLLVNAAANPDLKALLFFKAQISNDPFDSLVSWNETNTTTTPLHMYCYWLGVTCDSPRHPGRVTGLALPSLNLTSTLSPYLANLTFLYSLNLSTNNFHGSIPSDFGRLSCLKYLDLHHNLLQGEIPLSLTHCSQFRQIILQNNHLTGQFPSNFSLCLNLHSIDILRNQLSGAIPASLGSLPKLYLLGFGLNQFTSGIPPSLGNLSSLTYLDLAENNLKGRIPDELGTLINLKFLSFGVNQLSGEIPLALFNLSFITHFIVGSNNLTGGLPLDMGTTLSNLQILQVFYNHLGGPIPISLTNATALQKIVLHGNQFVGRIPGNLGSLPNLTAISFGKNLLEAKEVKDWEFFTSLSNCSNLRTLSLFQNKLRGVLPGSIANLSTQLITLEIGQNQISGIVPKEIGRYFKLTTLDLSESLFTGSIPSTVGMLQNLHILYLFINQLHGEIPTSIGNLSQLNELHLGYNNLEGNIPASLGNLFYLNALGLPNNKLNGTIPTQVLSQLPSLSQYLDLSHNLLTGPLPSQIGSLINLNALDLSENHLSGNIPASLGSCQLLGILFMQGNFFDGIIPSTLSGLRGIQELDLSRNKLSGSIPEFLANFRALYYLNLSFNNFEGRVPNSGVFGNASAISILGNYKLCGGDPALHLEQCVYIDGMRTHKSPSLKVVIPVVVAAFVLSILVMICFAYYLRKQRLKVNPPMPLKEPFVQISYSEILKATNSFSLSNLIGEGSFGTVYKGIMDSDPNQFVAIKVLKLEQKGAIKSFMAECDSLRFIRHRNLVNIVTICSSVDRNGDEFRALIFEYMPNGSLEEWLHPRVEEANSNTNSKSLSLVQRWNVVMDVALALDYLHHQCETPIVHCDLKPSNVLLDDDMSAHIGDFGLSRFLQRTIGSSHNASSSLRIIGSIGYIAPEYGMGGSVTTQGDVYSYGVLLLEIFTGKRPTDEMFHGGLDLHKYVEMAYPDRVLDVVDPATVVTHEKMHDYCGINTTDGREWIRSCMISILKVGLLCTQQSPNGRLAMEEVIKELLLVKKIIGKFSYAEASS